MYVFLDSSPLSHSLSSARMGVPTVSHCKYVYVWVCMFVFEIENLYLQDHLRARVMHERELIAFGASEGPEGVPADLIGQLV